MFGTVCAMNIARWNEHRLLQGRTSRLVHVHQYRRMQRELLSGLASLNRHLMRLNDEEMFNTPMLHLDVHRSLGEACATKPIVGLCCGDGLHLGNTLVLNTLDLLYHVSMPRNRIV